MGQCQKYELMDYYLQILLKEGIGYLASREYLDWQKRKMNCKEEQFLCGLCGR
jgi:hypothetical protein